MSNILSEYYGTPLIPRVASPSESFKNDPGFFRFGPNLVCYGECSRGVANDISNSEAFDVSKAITIANSELHLPFDIGNVIENLRRERYSRKLGGGPKWVTHRGWIRRCYYSVRELLPIWFRRYLQRAYLKDWRTLQFPHWPVDFTVDSLHESLLRMTMIAQGHDRVPFVWFWPDGAPSCLMLTHDVEGAAGRDFCPSLMDIDVSHGFRASFQVVPERRYKVPDSYVHEIRTRGFEFNIHDLNHDGRLFEEKTEFLRRAKQINEYAKKYEARGFRSGAMYRNQDWFDALEFSYDMSVPNVAHLEPQRGGCCTVMPYFIGKILELPVTTSQDYTMFQILRKYSIDLWKEQVDLIRQRNGLISFITHPDYLLERRARSVYESLLVYLRGLCTQYGIWEAVPGQLDRWWRARSAMKLIKDNRGYRIEGPECERACIAYATLDGERVVYSVDKNSAVLGHPGSVDSEFRS
jgi:hypothetical protein